MLKLHKNALLEAIKKSNLDPSRFQVEEPRSESKSKSVGSFLLSIIKSLAPTVGDNPETPTTTIRLRNSPLKFCVRHTEVSFDDFSYSYVPFMPGYPEITWKRVKGIEALVSQFETWLIAWVEKYLREQQLPDLWTQMELYEPLLAETDITDENTSDFSAQEKEELRRHVNEFRVSVIEKFNPSQSQEKFINDQIDYLSKAVDRLNRFDWRALAISTVIGIGINLSVDAEKGRFLVHLFQQAFQTFGKLLQ